MFDRLLYRLLTGAWTGFAFKPGAGPGWSVAVSSSDRLQDPHPDLFPSSLPVGLYVHIPFCRRLCAFCPYTKVVYSEELAKEYLATLLVEARQVLDGLGPRRISSIYFGGGTPMVLPEAISSVLDLFRERLVPGASIGVELHPDDVDQSSLDWLRRVMIGAKAGPIPTTMISIGVESLHRETLDYLGRGYGPEKALQTVEVAMDAGFGAVNVDVMTCIPGQSADEAASDMQKLFRVGVGQVSAYPLMDFSFTRGRTSHSLWSQRRTLAALARTGASEGYDRSSVWTWTRPDAPKYTSITRERFIGIGAGAATYLDGYFGVNTFDVRAYVNAVSEGRSPVALHSILTPQESALYWLFWRCYEGRIDLGSPEAGRVRGLRRWVNLARTLGLGSLSNRAPGEESAGREGDQSGILDLTDNGLFLYHIIERHYTRAYIGRLWAVCRESAFPRGIVL